MLISLWVEEVPDDVALCLWIWASPNCNHTTPEQSPFSSSSWIIWQIFESLPRVSQMASPLQRPFSYKKKGKGETVEQMHWLLPRGEHLEDWPCGYLWNDGFSFMTRTGQELSGNAEAKKEAGIFGIVSKSLVLTVINVTQMVSNPFRNWNLNVG